MKRLSIFGIVALVAVLAATPLLAGSAEAAKGEKTHDMTVEVVSVDATANTITVKDDAGELHTAPCMGEAIKQAKSVKAGDHVTITCKDNANGEHLGVTAIKAAKS